MRHLLPFLLAGGCLSSSAAAAWIPYYRMDSLAFLATDIVLCEEVGYERKSVPVENQSYSAKLTVVRTLKGSLRPGEQINVQVDRIFTRDIIGLRSETFVKRPPAPLGRALLFLEKDRGEWQPVSCGIKLILEGETYCYGQFITNPGPLYLARMAPENIDVAMNEFYGEELLLKDLQVAFAAAKTLAEAKPLHATDDVLRKNPRPKP